MHLGLLAPALLALSSASVSPTATDQLRIVGGEATVPGARPSVVAIVANRQLCAATVVSPTVLVTAAHCFSTSQPGTRISIHQGSSIDESEVTTSTEWAIHPQYCGKENCQDESFDYAYIKLEEPIELTSYPRPLTNQSEYDQIMRAGQPLILVGYGEDDNKLLGQKREVNTSIALFTPKGRQFLTAGEGRDSCRGDSGGPALSRDARGELLWLGVLSSGSRKCGKGGYYGVPLPILSWLKQESGYNPGGCLSESCLKLVKKRDENKKPPESGGCTTSIASRGMKAWGLSFLILAALGRLRRTRTLRRNP